MTVCLQNKLLLPYSSQLSKKSSKCLPVLYNYPISCKIVYLPHTVEYSKPMNKFKALELRSRPIPAQAVCGPNFRGHQSWGTILHKIQSNTQPNAGFFFSGSFRSCFMPVAFDDIPRVRFCCFAPGWAFVPCLRCHRCFTTLPLVDLYRRKCADRIMNFTADKFYRFATVVPPLGISERWVNKKMSAKTKGLTKKNSNFRKDKR